MHLETPIATRISRTVVAAVGIGISLSIGIFLASDFRQAIKAEKQRYQSAAYAFAAAASDAVAAGNTRDMFEVLRGVRELTDIVYVAARDAQGTVLAEMGTGARIVSARSGMFDSILSTTVEVEAEVRKAGQVIGSISMQAEVKGLQERYLTAFLQSAAIGAVLVALTAMFAKLQVSRLVRPLRSLAEEFLDIGQRSDLTRRLEKQRDDEVGVLVDAFNDMFGHIDDRDRQLKRHRETLEETVEQRTLELRLAKDEADAANQAKSAFLATMSHEIRTPMNGMMVMAEMLAAAPLAPRHQRYAQIVTRSGKNLLHIMNDILDFSKIESGKIELESIEFSLDAVIEDVACLFAERAREKNLSLAVYVGPRVPVRVVGDPVRLTQIVSNLVNNGLKFTETGGVTISVEMEQISGNIDITVQDTGIGIGPEHVGRIFTRFSQADATITRKFGGTGLGLSISKQLTELMGGSIMVESTIGSGSKFIVSVALEAVGVADGFAVSRPVTVLLRDGDAVSRHALTRALTDRGVSVADNAPTPDAIMLRAGEDLSDISGRIEAPIILVRSFAATTSPLPDGQSPVLDLSLPLSRKMFDKLCRALEQKNLKGLQAGPENSERTGAPDLQHLKVLAVDDVAVNREVLSEALRTFNIDCDLAESGAEAVDAATKKNYDIIFMDCSMPDMDGFEATRNIRVIESELDRQPCPIVALTGHVMGREGAQWKAAGMSGYLAKPFNMAQLIQVFQECRVLVEDGGSTETCTTTGSALEADPLLSSDSLEMFANIYAATGTDVRGKVFALFRSNAIGAYETAAAEVRSDGESATRLIHALKSNCSSAGAARATALCQVIETALSAGDSVKEDLLNGLGQVLRETLEAMDQMEGHAGEAQSA
ncbi:response regulator [Rhizobium deserti]|uniref:histidine kinase n=1 Tax=Rhizobium deserti TaxID=2547961 RepID=A0A4R5UA94_9HYPH|nr:ATP-binding protein [Rhizobium deserti]TDK31712.1 response regulator [Rhizobium deserti]